MAVKRAAQRTAPQSDHQTLQQEVKQALAHLYDLDYLRACPLAGWLAAGGDPSQTLQQALCEAIEHLCPEGMLRNGDSRCRPYLILRYRYIEAGSADETAKRLAISAATLRREQQKAIAAVCAFLKEKEQSLRTPPLGPRPIPRIKHFVGREQELAACRRSLDQDGFAVIAGPPGAGKTVLGAELAAQWQESQPACPVLWITLHNGRNTALEALLETIALALAAQGQPVFWRFLQAERRKDNSLSLESRVRYLLTILEAGGYLLCLDDYHLVNANPAIHALCADLLDSAEQGKLKLLVMSRTTPRFAREHVFQPLGGLGREDSGRLLEECGLTGLPDDLLANLYARTGGLPIFLRLFAAWVHHQGLENVASAQAREKLAALAENMIREQDIRNYLLHQVYDSLSLQEQCFLTCASAFRLPFDTEEAPIIALLKAEGVQDIETTCVALADRHIFTRLEGPDTITLHPLVRAYFAQRLRLCPAERERIHLRIGEYYEQRVGDALEAGYHYREAGHIERAARVLVGNVNQFINAGQAELALEQLEQLTVGLTLRPPLLAYSPGEEEQRLFPSPDDAREACCQERGGKRVRLNTELRFEVEAAREALHHLLGQREKQQVALDTLLTLAKALSDTQRLAMACNRQARFHEAIGDYTAAMAAAEAGQAAAHQAGDKAAEAESLNRWGRVLWRRSDYAAARERSQQALTLARVSGMRQSEVDSLRNLSSIDCSLGDYAAARDFCQQALALARVSGDQWSEAKSLDSLAHVYYDLGDYAAAGTQCERSLALRRAIGDRRGEATVLNNLAVIYIELGNYADAQMHLERALVIGRALGDRRGEVGNLNNLGNVCHALGDKAAARAHHEQALAICRIIGERQLASSILTDLGMTLEGLENLDEAEAAFREALAIRREIGQTALAIDDVAGLARIRVARGGEQEAKQYIEECLAYIAAHGVSGIEYVFEVYLTCIRILEAAGECEQAQDVLEEAHALLVQRADKISDESLRRSYLENVPANGELARAWAARHSH